MKPSKIIGNAVDNKIEQITSALAFAFLFIILVLLSGGGIIAALSGGWSAFILWLGILSSMGTIALLLGACALLSKFSNYLNNIKF